MLCCLILSIHTLYAKFHLQPLPRLKSWSNASGSSIWLCALPSVAPLPTCSQWIITTSIEAERWPFKMILKGIMVDDWWRIKEWTVHTLVQARRKHFRSGQADNIDYGAFCSRYSLPISHHRIPHTTWIVNQIEAMSEPFRGWEAFW